MTSLALLATPLTAAADDVVLKSVDGTTEIRGSLLDYSKGIFTLSTPLGEVFAPARLMICSGTACPSPQTILKDLEAGSGQIIPIAPIHEA